MTHKIVIIEVNGCPLEFMEDGEGPVVLALHGHISDKRIWEPCSKIFAANGYRFIAYTQRYYGTALWPDDGTGFTREAHVEDLLSLIQKMDLGPVHLLTRSYGGNIGMRAAIQNPGLFTSMVHYEPGLTDPITSHPEFSEASQMIKLFKPVREALNAGDETSAALLFAEVVYRLKTGTAATSLPPETLEMFKLHGRVVAPYFDMPESKTLTVDLLAGVTIPLLLMHGSDTHRWFSLIVEILNDVMPTSSKYVLQGVGHGGISEKPEEYCEVTMEFIRSAP